MLVDDFWSNVDTDGPYPDFSDPLVRLSESDGNCWIWTGKFDGHGYGQATRSIKAHRYAWMEIHGDITPGNNIDHLCRNRSCVRVGHLESVTPKENTLRGNSIQANYARRDACMYGHPLDESMVREYSYRGRRCLTCHKWNMGVYYRWKRDSKMNKSEKLVYADTLRALEEKQKENNNAA